MGDYKFRMLGFLDAPKPTAVIRVLETKYTPLDECVVRVYIGEERTVKPPDKRDDQQFKLLIEEQKKYLDSLYAMSQAPIPAGSKDLSKDLELLKKLCAALDAGNYNAVPGQLKNGDTLAIPAAAPARPVCECGVDKTGGNHSDWCPKYSKG